MRSWKIHSAWNSDRQYSYFFQIWNLTDFVDPQIFVSIQYRLLFYGYPSGDEAHALGIENLGLKDQRLAFQWAQENISKFGGDPSKVTIMGERSVLFLSKISFLQLRHYVVLEERAFFNIWLHTADAMTIYSVLVSWLFDHAAWLTGTLAIVESGSFYDIPCNWNISSIRQSNYQDFLENTGCRDIACLKTLDNAILFNVSLAYYADFLPSIDGDFMQAHPVELFHAGKFLSVPLLMGGKR